MWCGHFDAAALSPAAPLQPTRLVCFLPQDGSYRLHVRTAGSSGADGTAAVGAFAIDSVAPTVSFEGEDLAGWRRRPAAVATLLRLACGAQLSCGPRALNLICATVLADPPELVAGSNSTALAFTASEEGSTFFCRCIAVLVVLGPFRPRCVGATAQPCNTREPAAAASGTHTQ